MLKKIILFLMICSITAFGFAQKSKKSKNKLPKVQFVEMLINGETTPAKRYCPNDSILFDFEVLEQNVKNLKFRWLDHFNQTSYTTTPIKLAFPVTAEYPEMSTYKVSLRIEVPTKKKKKPMIEMMHADINVDYPRNVSEFYVNRGEDITIATVTQGNITFKNVQKDEYTPWEVVQSGRKCPQMIRSHVKIYPYIQKEYAVNSCGNVTWGDTVIKRPSNWYGDFKTEVKRLYPAKKANAPDTMKVLKITIVEKPQITINFDKDEFCNEYDMPASIELATNLTAFDWKYTSDKGKGNELAATRFDKTFLADYSGYYSVVAYMDTSLYKIFPDLRIVNRFLKEELVVEDCPLSIQNIITPNGDGISDVFAIKKLNPERKNELTIRDRNEKIVFYQKNYKSTYKNHKYQNIENAFSGISNDGKKLPAGAYSYEFTYDGIPEKQTFKGYIVILRD